LAEGDGDLGIHGIAPCAIDSVGSGNLEALETGPDQSTIADHPHEAAGRVRSAAEAQDEDFVPRAELVHQEVVAIKDVLVQESPKSTTSELVEPLGSDSGVIESDLLSALEPGR